MTTIINTHLGENRGQKRIWLEGHKLTREEGIGGMTTGSLYHEGRYSNLETLKPSATEEGGASHSQSSSTEIDEVINYI